MTNSKHKAEVEKRLSEILGCTTIVRQRHDQIVDWICELMEARDKIDAMGPINVLFKASDLIKDTGDTASAMTIINEYVEDFLEKNKPEEAPADG